MPLGHPSGAHTLGDMICNSNIYPLITMEELVTQAIPLWNESLSSVQKDWRSLKFDEKVDFSPPMPKWKEDGHRGLCGLLPHLDSKLSLNVPDIYRDWINDRQIILPEPPTFGSNKPPINNANLRSQCAKNGLQIFAKIENVDLRPGGQRPGGGPGALKAPSRNEHICATAMLFYDVANISIRKLCFRQRSSPDPALTREGLKEDVPAWARTMNWRTIQEDILGYKPQREPLYPFKSFYLVPTQELGKVKIPEGRMVAFPSLMQHRSTNFITADKRLPGSCKILSLFLVDPHVRIISSANVPPSERRGGRRGNG
ncbi:hypothetical protein N7509_012483 [Penicillium cosmopolitanum]|uniref:DUF4246 domain-containing protein n=1 Tax=Penicillium cosmopolitanum TaxID=1131564 RepID=A0A9W9SKF7_9EURO|nr:uncharacterized protein N7509_012483 [Penicillium cosmopolitanum]KAJ5379364.1 hypothetical protein N7509_012483 [Penicillium cosmopolitanum]